MPTKGYRIFNILSLHRWSTHFRDNLEKIFYGTIIFPATAHAAAVFGDAR